MAIILLQQYDILEDQHIIPLIIIFRNTRFRLYFAVTQRGSNPHLPYKADVFTIATIGYYIVLLYFSNAHKNLTKIWSTELESNQQFHEKVDLQSTALTILPSVHGLERMTGIEPATFDLEGQHSTN